MKKIFSLIVLISINSGSFLWADDSDDMKDLVDAGKPVIKYNSKHCSKYKFNDLLVTGNQNDRHCINLLKLPNAVLKEVKKMEQQQKINKSDNDSRITKFYVFEHSSLNRPLSIPFVKELSKGFGIPEDQVQDIRFTYLNETFKDFGFLKGLFIDEQVINNSNTYNYMKNISQEKSGLKISFGHDLPIYYPYGGFHVNYHIYIYNNLLIYIKAAYWAIN